MKLPAIYTELEEVASRLGMTVVLDRGSFKGGFCILEGEEIIVLNKSVPIEQRTRYLAEALLQKDLTGIYLKPAVRKWMDTFDQLDNQSALGDN